MLQDIYLEFFLKNLKITKKIILQIQEKFSEQNYDIIKVLLPQLYQSLKLLERLFEYFTKVFNYVNSKNNNYNFRNFEINYKQWLILFTGLPFILENNKSLFQSIISKILLTIDNIEQGIQVEKSKLDEYFYRRINIDGILIPKGYYIYEDWAIFNEFDKPYDMPLRFYLSEKGKIDFILDKNNLEYQELLKKLKSDTEQLQKALPKYLSFKTGGLLFSNGTNELKICLNDNRHVTRGTINVPIFIVPVFFQSNEDKSKKNKQSAIFLHFDENNKLESARVKYKTGEPRPRDLQIFFSAFSEIKNHNKIALENSYGHWEEFANIIVKGLQEN